MGRAVLGSIQISFWSNPNLTRLGWVTEFWTCLWPNIRVGHDVSSHQLGGSELLVNWLGFWIINIWVYFILTTNFHIKKKKKSMRHTKREMRNHWSIICDRGSWILLLIYTVDLGSGNLCQKILTTFQLPKS